MSRKSRGDFLISLLKALVIPVILIAGSEPSNGAVVNVATPVTQATIQSAVDSALPGDVVYIPAGNWSINGTVLLKEGIHVCGAGMDSTTLNKVDATSSGIFKLQAKTGQPFKISGIYFQGIGVSLFTSNSNSTIQDRGIEIHGRATDFEVTQCRLKGFAYAGIFFGTSSILTGHPTGVIDYNEITDNYYVNSQNSLGLGVALYGDVSWPTTLQLGDKNAVFVENNTFKHNKHNIASNTGSRYVFRYNTVTDTYYPFAACDAHGKLVGAHGSRSWEIYGNSISGGVTWPSQTPHATWAAAPRGGDGVIYNNTFSGMSRALSICIENWNNTMTYPVPDQIRSMYTWGNTLNGVSDNSVTIGVTLADGTNQGPFLQQGRDYFTGIVKPGYVPYSFPHPVAALNGRWKLSGTQAIQVDASATGNNGTAYGTFVAVPGKSGTALSFNGTNSYVEIPYDDSLNTPDFTVSAWANVAAITGTIQCLLSSRDNATYKGYSVFVGSTGKWQLYMGDGTVWQTLTGPTATTGWTHIAVTHTGTTNQLIVNGTMWSNSGFTFVPNTTQPLRIGRLSGGNFYFKGSIDDVTYYSRVLSQAEIQGLYNLVPDPSLETGLGTKWMSVSGTPTVDTTYKYDGAQSLCFNKVTTGEAPVQVADSYYIPVRPAGVYTLSVYAKGENIIQGASSTEHLLVSARWYDSNMVDLGVSADLNISANGTFDWTKFEAPFTAPAGATYYRITAMGMNGSSTGKGWIDMVTLFPAD